MFNVWLYSLLSVLLISAISLVGVFALSIKVEKLKNILIYMISFSAGTLLGDAFLHLLPEVVEESGFSISISLYIIAGLATSFIVEKVVHWRHCHMPISKEHKHPLAIMNLFGDAVHNFMDGVIIAISYLASIPIGIATTVAVLLHEIPQEISDFGVLIHGGFSRKKALFFNLMTALTAVAGAVITLLIGIRIESITVFLLPFTAGGFIYIAASDLIPELHKETKIKRSIMQILFLTLGVLIMALLLYL